MVHTALLGDIEIPVTYSKDEAVGIMKQAGLVGAGGAGFPTYVKYERPPRTLIVNAAESEPGYYADKLLIRDEPEALIDVFQFLNRTFSIDTTILGAEDVAKPYMRELEQLAKKLHNFSIGYFAARYKYGQERALCKALLGLEIPASDIPPQHGIIVNNVETLFNMYRALFRERPLRTKFLHLYGEIGPGVTVYEAPIGTLAADLIRIHGEDPARFRDCQLYDGGAILADRVADAMGNECLYPVGKTTNALLMVDPAKAKPRRKHYPHPDFKHNTIDVPWAAHEIVNVEDQVDRVRVPRKVRFGDGARLVVNEGQEVELNQTLGHPTDGLSVGIHASIPGRITRITDEFVEISRR